jgi:hypothetical protein
MDPAAGLSAGSFSDAPYPKISIVTPNFNYGHLIEATLRSVLMQNYPNLEYIVIDDGSTDNSVEVIKKYESKLGYFEHHQNCGQYPTINKGFSKATGEIFGWLNSDDIYFPWTLTAVAEIFTQFPEIDWIVGNPATIQNGVVHYVHPIRPYPRAMIAAGLFCTSAGGVGFIQQESSFWRRRLWEKAGGLRPSLRYAADFELWMRFSGFAELYSVTTLLGGFTDRGKANRSIANAGQYEQEVEKVIAEVRADPKSPQAVLARQFQRHEKFSSMFRINKRVARRMLPVPALSGPVLRWDFGKSQYWIAREKFN